MWRVFKGKICRCFPVQWTTAMPDFSEERLAELIELVPPAPPGWVRAAVELPRARAAMDELIVRAAADEQVRQAILADMEEAFRSAAVEPRPWLLESLRARLSELD
jgi:hypothetical protein